LVTLAVHKRVLVLSLEQLMAELGDSDEADDAEKALSNRLSEEFDEYQLVARTHVGWDAVLAALLALDRNHHGLVLRILERCAAMSSRDIEEHGGLYAALTSEEMLESDVAAERDDRRAGAGFVEPRAAAAFLKLAAAPSGPPATEHDALTRAYFRDVDRTGATSRAHQVPTPSAARDNELSRLLVDAGLVERVETPLLREAGSSPGEATGTLFIDAMRELARRRPNAFAERSEELAYLANVLVAASTIDGRRVRPIEGITAAVAVCDRGLRAVLESGIGRTDARDAEAGAALSIAVEALAAHPADGLFRAGWKDVPVGAERAPDLARLVDLRAQRRARD
jgi:hypothetical protein